MRLRTTLAVPADGARLDEALASAADAIAVTLNGDDFPVAGLRRAALDALPRIRASGKLAFVVVNHPRTRLLRDDLDAVVTTDLSGVVLPFAVEPQDVRDLAVLLREFEYGRGIEPGAVMAFPAIDTARGLLRAGEIAQAAPRVAGLIFDSHRYARDVGARDEEEGPRLAYARGAVVAAARAHSLTPLVACEGMAVRVLAQYGFGGAVFADVAHVAVANVAFTPGATARERAEAHLAAYETARAAGDWVATHRGEVVDRGKARKAEQIMRHYDD